MTEAPSPVVDLVGLIVGLLVVAAAVRAVTKRFRLPFTVTLVVAGMALAGLAERGPPLLGRLSGHHVSPEVILFVFLPTLLFESAFNMNFRQLRRNLLPVFTLAVPGLVLSTAVIGLVTWLLTPLDAASAALLGAIISATDPVAVISLFKQVGAPARLTVLVEGESLFNDATAIVAARILLGIAVGGTVTASTVAGGAVSFFVVFFGGTAVGCLMAWVVGLVMERVRSDPFIEISLTTILAYLSFLVAEEAFHVSGVMATVSAGIMIGNWGRSKISPSVVSYMEHFWEFMTWVGNALIFLLVGLRVDLGALPSAWRPLAVTAFAMLLSRAAVIYGLLPLAGRLPGAQPVGRAFKAVMFWGGLRGAIALAIVLSLEDFPLADTFVVLVTGSVLFTLLVQGLTVERLMRHLGLDVPPPGDRLARTEGMLAARKLALDRIPDLQTEGLFSPRIAGDLANLLALETGRLERDLDRLRGGELDRGGQRALLLHRCLMEERTLYYDFFCRGHLTERAYRDLCYSLDLQQEALKGGVPLPPFTLHPPRRSAPIRLLLVLLDSLPPLRRLGERLRIGFIAREYEESWGRMQGCRRVLAELESESRLRAADPAVVREVASLYLSWFESARGLLDCTAAQFPEFAGAMQRDLARRLVTHAEKQVVEGETRAGLIPPEVSAAMLEELSAEIHTLEGPDLGRLRTGASELLRTVPFFASIPREHFDSMARRMIPRTVPAGEVIIREGDDGDSLFLISRGVVRVSRAGGGVERDVGTLFAGDFFGEMALLHGRPRTATCRAVTPAALYELQRSAFEECRRLCPAMYDSLLEADRRRREENLRLAPPPPGPA